MRFMGLRSATFSTLRYRTSAFKGRPVCRPRNERLRIQRIRPLRSPIRAEFGGQYEENFEDISKHLTDLFTYKAVKTVLAQLQEMDSVAYKWLYNFAVEHRPSQSQEFCKLLIKENRELGERVMKLRCDLIEEWFRRVKPKDVLEYVSEKNLSVMRECLKDSVNFIFTAKPRPELNE